MTLVYIHYDVTLNRNGGPLATLTIRNIPNAVHARLKARAERNRRSLNSEAVLLLEQAIETLPDEAELRARYLGEVEGGRASKEEEYGSASLPLSVLREAARPPAIPARRAVLALFDRERGRLRSLGVRRIGLFGSVLRGQSRPESDIDVLVEFDPARKSFDALVELASWLETQLGHEVELVTTEGLSPYIGPKILEEAEFVGVDD